VPLEALHDVMFDAAVAANGWDSLKPATMTVDAVARFSFGQRS